MTKSITPQQKLLSLRTACNVGKFQVSEGQEEITKADVLLAVLNRLSSIMGLLKNERMYAENVGDTR